MTTQTWIHAIVPIQYVMLLNLKSLRFILLNNNIVLGIVIRYNDFIFNKQLLYPNQIL